MLLSLATFRRKVRCYFTFNVLLMSNEKRDDLVKSSLLISGQYKTRTCDLYDRVDGQRVTLASTFPTVPLRTGRTPFSVSGSPKVSNLSHRNHRKRTINKNNRHRTTLRVVVCAACLS